MTLDDAIAQLINLGEKDPLEIARKIQAKNDKVWLSKELMSLAEEIVSEKARHRLGAERRSAQLALRPGDQVASSELGLRSVWVPLRGWTRAADMSAEDCELVAGWYAKLASAAHVRAQWYSTVAGLIRSEGVGTLGKLRAALPVLPAGELEAA